MRRTAKFGRRITRAFLTFCMMSSFELPSAFAWTTIVARIVIMIAANADSRSMNVAGILGEDSCEDGYAWLCDRQVTLW